MRKRNVVKQRNFLVPMMRLDCKPGPHADKMRQRQSGTGHDWMQEYRDELSACARKTGL